MNARSNTSTFEARQLPPEIAAHPATLQDMADLANAVTPALQQHESSIAALQAQQRELNGDFADFADELLRGLDDDDDEPPAPSINVNVLTGPQERGGNTGPYIPSNLSAEIADLKRVMMLPIVDVFDAKGNPIGARRVDPDEEKGGGR